jgi:hypothetical protein
MQPERVSRDMLRPASLWQLALTPKRCALPRALRQTSWVRGIVRGQLSTQSNSGGNLRLAVILRSGKDGSASRSDCSSVRPEQPYYPGIPVLWEYSIQGWVLGHRDTAFTQPKLAPKPNIFINHPSFHPCFHPNRYLLPGSPTGWIVPLLHIAVKTRVRPCPWRTNQSMFHRVVMDVIHMPF